MASKKFVVKNGLRSDGNVLINKSIDNGVDELQVAGSVSVSDQIKSTLTTGTAPLIVASTTGVTNLNADLLDGQHGSYYLDGANFTGTLPNDYVTLGTMTTGNYVATIAGTTNEVEVTGSGSETAAVTIGLPNDVTIGNNLTVTNNIVMADSSRIQLGDDNDLEIYHTGSDSVIAESGGGRLKLQSDTGVDLGTTTGETMVSGVINGAVTLYYDNAAKLDTTTGGVEVTGDLTVSGQLNVSTIDTTDSSGITVVPSATFNSDVTIENDLRVRNDIENISGQTILPAVLGSADKVLTVESDGLSATWKSIGDIFGSGIDNVVEDTTPQLGGDLDLNSQNITGTGNINITGNVTASGSLFVSTIDTTDSSAITVTPITNFDSDVTVGNNLTVNGYISGPATMVIDPAAVGDNTGEVIIAGDLIVQGNTTQVDSNVVNIGDAFLTLNSDEAGAPSQNAGIEVERGTSTNVALRWNESNDKWEITTDGSAYNAISTVDATVTSLTGTANEVEVDTSTGDVTVGLPNDVTIGNELTVTTGLFTPLIDTADSSAITVVPAATFNSDVTVENNLTVTNDVTATRFIGDGSQLTGLVATYEALTDTDTTGRTTGSLNRFNGSAYVPTAMTEDAGGNVTITGQLNVGTIDTTDSSAITVVPATTFRSDITVENDIVANNKITVSGNVVANANVVVSDEVQFTGHSNASSTLTTTATTQVALHNLSVTAYAGAEVIITATQGNLRHITKLLITHDASDAYATEYGEILTGASLATYDVDLSGGNIRLLTTPASATSTKFNVSVVQLYN